ncbi:MAG: agmatinase [Pseudomonadota bacterium]
MTRSLPAPEVTGHGPLGADAGDGRDGDSSADGPAPHAQREAATMKADASGLNFLAPEHGFLEPDRADAASPEAARAVVIPYGLEASVSYGAGTAKGPAAILAASHQLELYDEEFGYEPCTQYGVATLDIPAPDVSGPGGLKGAIAALSTHVDVVVRSGALPLVLGGEHALTPGAIAALAVRYEGLAILQIDAHADLRDGYQGEAYSHASAMRRALDDARVSLVSVGIRAISQGEIGFLEANADRIAVHWAKDMATWSIDEIVAPLAGRPIYVTLDVDGLDAAIMPATGTPEPGGLGFWQTCEIIRAAARVGEIVGGDVVELAPIPGLHACDFTAAKLAYKMLSYALMPRSSGPGV